MPESRGFDIPNPMDHAQGAEGKNYLLAIGIDAYTHCRPLKNAVGDAKAFVGVMKEQYGFSEECIFECYDEDATREGVWKVFRKLKRKLTSADNLIIYYAGHGHLDEELDWGYWVPVEARPRAEHTFLENKTIIEFIKRFTCYHLVLISDSCFSGSFFGDSRDMSTTFSAAPSRWAITSGRKQKVLDGDPGLGSPFSDYLLKYLRENPSSLLLSELGNRVKISTNAHTELYQTPRAEPLQIKGHEGGEFVFRRKAQRVSSNSDPLQKDLSAWNQAKAAHTINAYRTYLDHFPEGEFQELAESRIAQLSAFSRRDKDIAAWRKAKEQHSVEGYTAYLRDFPEGDFVLLAEKALDRVRKKQASLQAEIHRKEKLQAYLQEGNELFEEGDYEGTLECWEEALAIAKEGEKDKIEKAIAEAREKISDSKPAVHPLLQEFGIKMIRVEGGTFRMGSEEGRDNEKPVHEVTLSSYDIGKYPITQAQWEKVMGSNPSHFKGCPDCPVEKVSWQDAQEFIGKLNQQTGQQFSLPTEGQWEFAARGGNESKGYRYAGSNELEEVGWYWKNSGDEVLEGEWKLKRINENNCKTHPIGEKKPNELGLYDMSGNVWEWCEDWFGAYPAGPLKDPKGPESGRLPCVARWVLGLNEAILLPRVPSLRLRPLLPRPQHRLSSRPGRFLEGIRPLFIPRIL